MQYTLGIDQSYTCTGYVIVDESNVIHKFGTFKTTKDKDVYERAIELADFIEDLVTQYSIKDVRIEGLAFGIRGDATRDLAGLQFVVITRLKVKHPSTVVKIIAPTSLKKFATGTGKSDKAAMITAVPQNVMDKFVTAKLKKSSGLADVTDAYWLALFKS